MSYTIELDESEMALLRIMSAKGYDCGLLDAINHKAHIVHMRDDWARYELPEHAVWEIHEQWNEMLEGGNDPLGPFVAVTLRPKFAQLMSEVV